MEETPSTVAIPIMFYDLLGYQHACLSRLFVTVLESSAVALAVRLASASLWPVWGMRELGGALSGRRIRPVRLDGGIFQAWTAGLSRNSSWAEYGRIVCLVWELMA